MPNSFRKPVVGLLALLVVVGAGLALVLKGSGNTTQNSLSAPNDPSVPNEMKRREAPQFELADAAGKTRKLSESRGSAVIVHFWAAWCPPCLDEIPKILALAKSYEGKPLRVWMVSLDEKWEDAQKVLPGEKLATNMISVLDVGQKVSDRYGSYQYPETYLLDADQKIVFKWVGPQPWESEGFKQAIDSMLPK